MQNYTSLFQQFHPSLFHFAQKIKNAQTEDISTLLFYGQYFTGKEWAALQLIKYLNCDLFLTQEHQTLTCPTCKHIHLLKPEYGIYTLLIGYKTTILEYYLSLLERKTPLGNLSFEAFSHELAKLTVFLEAQFIKEQKSSPSKKIGQKKLQEYRDNINQLQTEIRNQKIENFHFLFEIIKDLPHITTDISIEYLKWILEKLQIPNPQLKYRTLIIKDPIRLKNQTLFMNTLLKTVEESKKNLIIIFISEKKSQILKTIQSRSTGLHFKTINPEYMAHLQNIDPLYHFSLFHKSIPQPLSLKELLNTPNITEQEVIEYITALKSQYYGASPLYQAKQKELDKLILALKEYRISVKNIIEVLNYL